MIAPVASEHLFRHLERVEYGELTLITPDGRQRCFQGRASGFWAQIHIRDWRMLSSLANKGSTGFAQSYRDGLWDSDDLMLLLSFSLQNQAALGRYVRGSLFGRLVSRLAYFFSRNTVRGSKKNIRAHYDLGNDFYALWLDSGMTYSSALFSGGSEDLASAQLCKYDRIIDRLGRSGSVLEIGCGWGGFADRASARGDFALKGITLSEQQHAYACDRLNGRARIALEDYRSQTGIYDHIVSIEMFEAVGERYWPTYFNTICRSLSRGGKAVIQTITIDEQNFDRYRRGGDFVRSLVFPGGMLSSLKRFEQEASRSGLRLATPFCFGLDYARTLECWLHNFDQKTDAVRALGFDDGFIRLWRFYLAACAVGFREGRTDVMQVELSHA